MQKITCPACQHVITASEQPYDRIVNCSKCGKEVDVPAAAVLHKPKKKFELDKYSGKKPDGNFSKYAESLFIVVLRMAAYLTICIGGLWTFYSIINSNWGDMISAVGTTLGGLVQFYLARFLAHLDRAAHKILNS